MGSSRPGKQSDQRFLASRRLPWIVDHNPMMGGQRQFRSPASARPAIATANGLPEVSSLRSERLSGRSGQKHDDHGQRPGAAIVMS